jgi:hypothetical protein
MGSTKKTLIKFTSKRVCFEYLSTETNSINSKETLFSCLKGGFTKFLKFFPIFLKNIAQIHIFWTLIKTLVLFQ